MAFVPPRCPNLACPYHRSPESGFFVRRGWYHPRCRIDPVPRFRCRSCHKGFSRQTFRHDYRDRRPDCNPLLFQLLVGGMSLRQAGRLLRLDIHALQKKKRKLASTCALLHRNLSPSLPAGLTYVMDEEETFETTSIRPLTVPVLIERETWFVVATAVGPIRRGAPRGTERRRRQDREEREHGARRDRSRACVRGVLGELQRRVGGGEVVLRTDKKSSYGPLARRIFGNRLRHETTSSKLERTKRNPLFAINTTLTMTRDNCGRLRWRSWLVSKKAERLRCHLQIFTAYRNYVRQRFNRDGERQTPANLLGLLPRNLRPGEVITWRQDWGERSVHPMSFAGGRSIADYANARRSQR